MIKPETLWGLFKNCPDSKYLGDICRALGRQNVDLDFGQKMIFDQIQQDSEWMDERVDTQRQRWKDRQRKTRESRKSQCVTQCHGDKPMSRNVTETSVTHECHDPSIQPSIHNNISSSSSSSKGTTTHLKILSTPAATHEPPQPPPSSFSGVEDYLASINLLMYDPEGVKAEFINLVRNKWIDKHGKPIADWKAYIKNICDRLNMKKYAS